MILARRHLCALLLAGTVLPIRAASAAASSEASEARRAGRLLEGTERVEDVRAVKRLHDAWAHYAVYGLWDAIGDLFAEDGELQLGDELVRGRTAIAGRLRAGLGGGQNGLLSGALHAQLLMTPVVTLSAGGTRARGRWHEVAMSGRLGGEASWAGGIHENGYVKRDGVWQIARLHYTPQFAGSYAEGWRNVSDDLGIVPYHYAADTVGTPPETVTGDAPAADDLEEALVEAERRLATLEDEDAVRNLQLAYGYYVDRKMWDDVVDLFAPDGTFEIVGTGTWRGPTGIRRALERDGPAGLRHGELNDHVQLNPLLSVSPAGTQAWARGVELGMIGRNHEYAQWTLATFDNSFVKHNGVWKLGAIRLRPVMRADYYKGWGEELLPEPVPPAGFAPDAPALAGSDGPRPVRVFDHPVTGRPAALPPWLTPLAEPFPGGARPRSLGTRGQRLDAAEAALRRVGATDAIENISGALGNWLDDSQWSDLAALFAASGERKSPAAGFYVGPERIRQMQELRNGPLRRPRRSIPMHLRVQPVISVSPDGRSAKLRTRLLQFNSRFEGAGSLTGGMYEDRAVLEHGTWKFQSNVIDHIWRTPGYKEGWARVPEDAGESLAPSPVRLLAQMPPDRPLDGPAFAPFPAIGPLAFHYRNPVSGREPPDMR